MKTKKILLLLIIMNLFVLSTWAVPQVHANVVTKPLAMAGKKALKELATDSAVEMAEHLVFEKMINDFVNSDYVDNGFGAACLDGPVDKLDDCPADKRVQVKQDLSSADKSSLSNKIENLIETKTNTDTRLTKFLDIFVPIFIVGGAVAWIASELDDDSKGLVDELSLQALEELQIIKPMNVYREVLDFTPFIASANAYMVDTPQRWGDGLTPRVVLEFVPKQLLKMNYKVKGSSYSKNFAVGKSYKMAVGYSFGSSGSGSNRSAALYASGFQPDLSDSYYSFSFYPMFQVGQDVNGNDDDVMQIMQSIYRNHANGYISNGSVNSAMNAYVGQTKAITGVDMMFADVLPTQVQDEIDLNTLRPSDETNYKGDGGYTLPGQKSIPIKTPEGTRVFPGTDGTWTDGDGTPVNVDENTLIVDDVTPIEGETPPGDKDDTPPGEKDDEFEFACKEKMELPDFKPVSKAFTNAFPFSIPWDIKRAIDAAFGGVGDSKPSFPLPMFGDGVELTIPDMVDNWMPFLRGFLVLMFDVSILFLFYRFMKGGGD